MRRTVLVAGATGLMGTKIARALAARDCRLRLLVRRPERAAALRELDAEIVQGDVADAESLARACDGVDVVVSALAGLGDVIVDGQTRLLEAAQAAGVKRFLPSDFSFDFFGLADGENRNMDLRRELNRRLDRAPAVKGTSVLTGCFMEMLLRGLLVDTKHRTVDYWGDETQAYDFTATDDAAQYVAAAALDPGAPRILRFAGDSLDVRGLAEACSQAFGGRFEPRRRGDVADLAVEIRRQRQANPEGEHELYPEWQLLQYVHGMMSGRGKLSSLDNDRYPEIEPMTVREFLSEKQGWTERRPAPTSKPWTPRPPSPTT